MARVLSDLTTRNTSRSNRYTTVIKEKEEEKKLARERLHSRRIAKQGENAEGKRSSFMIYTSNLSLQRLSIHLTSMTQQNVQSRKMG
jgi:hypothetical protein